MFTVTVKYKVKKVEALDDDGVMQKKFIPLRKKSIWGIGFWTECEKWQEAEKQLAGEKFLGINSDSTLTHIRKFIEYDDPNPPNEFYN
jgi:hypothetical protein